MQAITIVQDFLNKYFIHPIQYGTGYNVVNTPVLALLFVLMVDATQKAIKKLGLSMNQFLKAFVPYVLLGGVMRVLTDAGVYPQGFVFVTPGIYLLLLALTFVDAYFNLPLGWLLLAVNLSGLAFRTNAYLLVLLFAIMTTGFSLIIFRLARFKISYLLILAVFAHMLDAASTFIAIDVFNYAEQHVLANLFMNISQTAAIMFPLKLLALLVVAYFFEDLESQDTKAFLYWMVIAIGIGPGIRNTLMATMGL